MRIAHVTATFPPNYSGTGLVCYYNALELAKRGHKVTVFTSTYPLDGHIDPPLFEVQRLKPLFQIGNAPFLGQLIQEVKNFDLIHLHHPFIFGAELMMIITKLINIPLVITHHNDLIGDDSRKLLFWIYSQISGFFMCRIAKKIIVVTKDHAQSSHLFKHLEKRGKDVVEISNGVDTELFHPNTNGEIIRTELKIPKDEINILFVGALDRAHHYRRVDILLHAINQLNDPAIHLTIVGDGDRKKRFSQLSEQLGLQARVYFLGKVPHEKLPEVYASADLVVLPSSIQESFGMVLIEAMACGKPVITSELPGVRSIFNIHTESILVKPVDVNDLKEKIHCLIHKPELRKMMGENGRKLVEKSYSLLRVGRKLEELYLNVIEIA